MDSGKKQGEEQIPKISKSLASELNNTMRNTSTVPSAQGQAIDFDKIKSKLEALKKNILKKYKFTISILLLPSQASPMFEEDELVPKEISDSKPLYMMMLIPED